MKLTEKLEKVMNESLKKSIMKSFKVSEEDFEKRDDSHSVKTIAKTKEGYVGFSHRAACEFKIGDKLFDAEYGKELDEKELDKMKFVDRGSEKIKTMEQARKAAVNFAEYVS